MECQSCEGDYPEAAGFCQTCARPVAPGFKCEQVMASKIATSSELPPSYEDGRRNTSELVLATILIIVGVGIVALSRLVIGGSDSRYYGERDFFASVEANGYVVIVTGVCMILYYLSLRRTMPRPEREVPERAIERSFFRTMDPSTYSGAIHRTQTRVAAPEDRVGTGIVALLYLLSICIPAMGSIAGAIVYANAKPGYKHVGKMCMIFSAIGLVVMAALGVLLFMAILPSG